MLGYDSVPHLARELDFHDFLHVSDTLWQVTSLVLPFRTFRRSDGIVYVHDYFYRRGVLISIRHHLLDVHGARSCIPHEWWVFDWWVFTLVLVHHVPWLMERYVFLVQSSKAGPIYNMVMRLILIYFFICVYSLYCLTLNYFLWLWFNNKK